MRPALTSRLSLAMPGVTSQVILANRLTELVMHELAPCDLGDGIEVVHDVEAVEIEMDCDLAEDALIEWSPAQHVDLKAWFDELWSQTAARSVQPDFDAADTLVDDAPPIEEELGATMKFNRELVDELGTHQFVRYSAPYERIEIQLDAGAFIRATIADAMTLDRDRSRV